MKFVLLAPAALTAMLVAAPLCAQTASVLRPAPTATPTVPATTAGTKYTLDTPIETIAADPAGKAVLDKDIPGMTAHPMYDTFKSMTLNALQPVSQGQLSDAQLAAAKADLAAIK